MGRRVLVATLPPFDGGVPAKTRKLCRHLMARGHTVTVAYYATFRHAPGTCVPLWRLGRARPGLQRGTCFDHVPCVAVGCWLPELEASYYRHSALWRRLIGEHDRHVAVGGNVLTSYPLQAEGVPHLVWCASGVLADRIDRQRRMDRWRRLYDRAVVVPTLAAMERRVLSGDAPVLGVSGYTLRSLEALGMAPGRGRLLPIPFDEELLTPPAEPAAAGIVGFAARINDPRKNVGLLLAAVRQVRERGIDCRLRLAGAAPAPELLRRVAELGLTDAVEFLGELSTEGLAAFYRGLDVFAIPSLQEGFCISGIEAMACAVPVVSTPCGGPEDYVRPGTTGFLAADAADMADRLAAIITDRSLRDRLAGGARRLAVEHYAPQVFADRLAEAWHDVWGERP